MKRLVLILIAAFALPSAAAAAPPAAADNPRVRMTTSLGVIELELDARKAPKTVANFLEYVNNGFYNGTTFHRVIPDFMIQGGGFEPGMRLKPARAPILNEADNGLKNFAGTIAMARTSDPHSATAQFFINTIDNSTEEWRKRVLKKGVIVTSDDVFLDHKDKTPLGWGYCVFGRVTQGMDVVKKIEAAPTRITGTHQNVPVKDVVIKKVEVLRRK
jgi:cyclophilin family peptidyl-prolyl cis-trans isomerase